jgi:hypothetical protein
MEAGIAGHVWSIENRTVAGVTRSKEIRRIEDALAQRDESELRWALAQCELRRKFMKRHSDRWYRIEKAIRAALAEIQGGSN